MMKSRVIVMVCLLAAVAMGCQQSDFKIVPIAGRVTLDGQPVAGARVMFSPKAVAGELRAGPDSYGRTDADGRFQLQTIKGQDGAVVATHTVRFRTRTETEDAQGKVVIEREEVFAARYNDESELTYDVAAGGTSSADFELSSK